MIFFLIALLALSLYKIKFTSYNEKYLSRDNTLAIKGIFAIIIFCSHVRGYILLNSFLDSAYVNILNHIGQLMVVMFLFYSGYGICESIKKKGGLYIDGFFKNRFLKTLIHFIICVFLFLITDVVLGIKYPLKNYFLCWFGYESIGNSNWFMFVMFALYLIIHFGGFLTIKKGKSLKVFAILVTFLSVILWIILYVVKKDGHWYNTLLALPFGIWFSIYKDLFENIIKNKLHYYLILFFNLIIFVGLYFLLKLGKFINFIYSFYSMVFALLVVLITIKVSIKNLVLCFLGKISFYIYILQRLSMIIISNLFNISLNYIFSLICLTITILLAWLAEKYFCKLDKVIFKNKN